MIRSSDKQAGFTIIELLVSVVIMSALLIGISTFLVNSLVGNSVRGARSDLLREAQLTLDTITKDARLSAFVSSENIITDDNSPDAEENFGRGWVSGGEVLILANSAEDSNRNILFQDDLHYTTEKNNLVYFVNEGTLYKRTLAADNPDNRSRTTCPEAHADDGCPADTLMVQNVTGFNVRYFDGNNNEVSPSNARSIEIGLTLQASRFGREVKAEYTTRMVFRNE